MSYDEEYFNSEEFKELLNSYETAMKEGNNPLMDADDLVDIADYYNMIGEYDQAEDVVEYALELYPHATLPNVFMARLSLQDGCFDEAEDYAEAIEDKDDPDYHYLIAEIKIAMGQVKEADRYLLDYGKTVDDDEYEDFVRDCANLFIDYGQKEKAFQWIMRAKGDDGQDFQELMARTQFQLGKYKEAAQLFNELIDKNPYSTKYWNALAAAQFMNEEYNDCITSCEYALAIDPKDTQALSNKANGLARLGNYEEALKFYQRYAEQEPKDAVGLFHQGACLMNMGKAEEASKILEQALKYTQGDRNLEASIYQELAFCYGALKDLPKALEMLDKTEELPCDHTDMLVVRGHIQLENDQQDDAQKSFTKAIKMSDNAPHVLLRIIVSLYDNHYVHACYEILKKFFSLMKGQEQENKDGYAYMALCCYELNKGKEFLKYLKMVCEKNPKEARLVLGFMFPEGMEVKDYYIYMQQLIKQ